MVIKMLKEGVKIMLKKFKGLLVEEQGQGMTEYGLILGGIALVVIAVVTLFGERFNNMFKKTLDVVDPPAAG